MKIADRAWIPLAVAVAQASSCSLYLPPSLGMPQVQPYEGKKKKGKSIGVGLPIVHKVARERPQ